MQRTLRLLSLALPKMEAQLQPFPTHSLLPKTETQALAFSKKFNARGKGVRVAVLDSGVDPAAAGLTSRVVDVIDCSGSGDCVVEDAQQLSGTEDERFKHDDQSIYVRSPTGRILQVSKAWQNPSGQWRTGYKRAYDFWPSDLIDRRKRERKAAFERGQQELLSRAQRELDVFEEEQKNSKKSKSESQRQERQTTAAIRAKSDKSTSRNGPVQDDTSYGEDNQKESDTQESSEELEKRKDLQERIAALSDFASSFQDPGPIIEVVAWHDGTDHRCIVAAAEGEQEGDGRGIPIKDEKGQPFVLDLTQRKPMTDFRKEKHFEAFGTQDMLTYSVNFYEQGKIVSLVTQANAHGTHVAGIIGAHNDDVALDGVAPEVEIVSLKIADCRLGGIETNQALWRAARAIIDTECDLANMSYGESGAFGMEGKGTFIQQLVQEVVRKRSVPFCVSAGNNGPALSTVGWPAAAGGGVFSIGAWVSVGMQQSEYALATPVPASIFTWSSRGPLYDGARGVDMYAPGAAITSTPRYTLKHSTHMNGTSMSSPNCCGNLALLISACKARDIPYTPASLRKAIAATWRDVGDHLGVGLIQVQDAFDYLQKHAKDPDADAEWEIQVTPTGRGEAMHGIYLRTQEETSKVQQFLVEISPQFLETRPDQNYGIDMNLSLSCASDWVSYPKFVAVGGKGRMFGIRVDPSSLEAGYHYTSIDAFVQEQGDQQSFRKILSVPITITKPLLLSGPTWSFGHTFQPGQIHRKFIQVPLGAHFAEIKLTSAERPMPSQIWLHVVQMPPLTRISDVETQAVLPLISGEPVTKRIKLIPGLPLEFCIVQGWNAPFTTPVEVEVEFHGLSVPTLPVLDAGNHFETVMLRSSLRPEALADLDWCLKQKRFSIRPSKHTLTSLSSRSQMPDGQSLFSIELGYSLKQTKKGSVSISTAQAENLYDSAISTLFVILDANQRVVQCGHMYQLDCELDKGEYTVKVQFCHWDHKMLQGLKDACLTVAIKLDGKLKDAKLPVYRDHIDVFTGQPISLKGVKLAKGDTRALVVKTSLSNDLQEDLYKDAQPGQQLVGTLNLTKSSYNVGQPFSLVLPPKPVKEKEDEDKEKSTLFDLQLEMGKQIPDEKEKRNFVDNLTPGDGDNDTLRWYAARLEAVPSSDSSNRQTVSELCSKIIKSIDQADLTRKLHQSKTAETKAEKKAGKQANEVKAILLEALYRRAEVCLSQAQPPSANETSSSKGPSSALTPDSSLPDSKDSTHAYRDLQRWQEASDKKMLLLGARIDIERNLFGSALAKLKKVLSDFGSASNDKEAVEARKLQRQCIEGCDWQILIETDDKAQLARHPPTPFIF